MTPSDRRLTMSVLLKGGSDANSTSYFSSVPVTLTTMFTFPFFVSARKSSPGLFRLGSWNSMAPRVNSYRFPR